MDTAFTGNPSSSWTAIAYGLELLKKGLIWRVGNGESVRIWRDSWIPRECTLKVIGPCGKSRLNRVSSLIDANGAWKAQLQILNWKSKHRLLMKQTSLLGSQRKGAFLLSGVHTSLGYLSCCRREAMFHPVVHLLTYGELFGEVMCLKKFAFSRGGLFRNSLLLRWTSGNEICMSLGWVLSVPWKRKMGRTSFFRCPHVVAFC
jgi:hypothetical protein